MKQAVDEVIEGFGVCDRLLDHLLEHLRLGGQAHALAALLAQNRGLLVVGVRLHTLEEAGVVGFEVLVLVVFAVGVLVVCFHLDCSQIIYLRRFASGLSR